MFKHWWYGLLALLIMGGCQRCQIKKDEQSQWANVVSFAQQQLPLMGTLVQQADGYAYVKVDDRYINELFPMLHAQGFSKPPYFRRSDSPGAHISVLYENEHVRAVEAGRQYAFTLNDIIVVTTKKKISYIILQVKAPELEMLRQKYGLSPLLRNEQFHITIAKKVEK